jgi:uncharacterized protein YcfJ
MKETLALLFTPLLLSTIGAAEPLTDWSRVAALSPGVSVQIVHHGLKQDSGRLVDATSDRIEIDTASGSLQLSKADVRRVSVSRKSRKNRTLIGLGLGAAAGAAILAIGASSGDIDIRRDLVTGAGAVVGGTAGAAIGAATAGPETIYRVP